jgi:hypothetical protein
MNMSADLLEEARLFLVYSLQGKQSGSESRHPWRRSWEFAVLHSLRVESYVMKILSREERMPAGHEASLIRLAAILHDICRLEQREGHAARGAEIAEKWLREQASIRLEESDIEKIVDMIATHSNKAAHETDFRKAVLKDADTLDEIGVMSIFMASNWVDARSPFFFYDLRQRLIDAEIPFCDQEMAILNTQGAREILKEKKIFVQNVVSQLADELQADDHIEQILVKISKNGTSTEI